MAYRFKDWSPTTKVPAVAMTGGADLSQFITRGGVFVGPDQDAGAFAEDFKGQVEWDGRTYPEACLALNPAHYWPMDDDSFVNFRNLGSDPGAAAALGLGGFSRISEFSLGNKSWPTALVRGAENPTQTLYWPSTRSGDGRISTSMPATFHNAHQQSYVVWKRNHLLPDADHYYGRASSNFMVWQTPNATSNRPVARIYLAANANGEYIQAWATSAAALGGSVATYWREDSLARTDMMAFTYDGLTLRLFYNGTEVQTTVYDYSFGQDLSTVANHLYWPLSTASSVNHPRGTSIGHSAWWDRALSPGEINDLWRVGCPLDEWNLAVNNL